MGLSAFKGVGFRVKVSVPQRSGFSYRVRAPKI